MPLDLPGDRGAGRPLPAQDREPPPCRLQGDQGRPTPGLHGALQPAHLHAVHLDLLHAGDGAFVGRRAWPGFLLQCDHAPVRRQDVHAAYTPELPGALTSDQASLPLKQ